MSKDYRRCISCRKMAHRSEFWRVVRCSPSKEVRIDVGEIRLEGRSAYLCKTASCLEAAQKKNRVGRSFRSPVCQDIYQDLAVMLKKIDPN